MGKKMGMVVVGVLVESGWGYFYPAGTPAWYPLHEGGHIATLLDGEAWALGYSESVDALKADAEAVKTTNTTRVPSTADAAPPGYFGQRGTWLYERTFEASGDMSYKIEFMGCAFYCKAWINGSFIGENFAGGYAPWSVNLPDVAGAVKLTVLADNRFNDTTAPLHTGGDFWHFGGLVRSVVLHSWPRAENSVFRALVFPYALDQVYETWALNLSISLCQAPGTEQEVDIDISWPGDALVPNNEKNSTTYRVKFDAAGYGTLSGLEVPSTAKAWHMDDPQLTYIRVATPSGGGVVERFGLRVWSTVVYNSSTRISLNGKVVKLTGWNHHTQFPDTGMSPTEAQMDADVGILVRGGANYVRGAHYPQDQRWLDRLDELGFAMWEEALGPDVRMSDLDSDIFMPSQLQQLDQMLNASANHPSIMTWGYFNEGPSDDSDACFAYAACAQRLLDLDSTRFVTWASNKGTKDVCLDAATLIAFNSYPYWYSSSSPYDTWTTDAAWVRSEYPDTPLVVSETGAGGVYEWNNATDPKWSLNFQLQVITQDVDVILQNDQFSGITLWHMFDFKGNDDATAYGPCDYVPYVYPPICAYINVSVSRPGGENHKGVVDYWRRPKPSFHAVAARYHATPTYVDDDDDDSSLRPSSASSAVGSDSYHHSPVVVSSSSSSVSSATN